MCVWFWYVTLHRVTYTDRSTSRKWWHSAIPTQCLCFSVIICMYRLPLPWASCHIRKIAPGMPGTFSPTLHVNDPDMHRGTCMAHVLRCMPGSLTSGFRWSRRRGKRSLRSRRMRNQRFYVSGKRPTYASPNIVYFVVVVLSVAVDSHDTLSILFRIHTSFSKVWIKIAKFGCRKITLKMDVEWGPFYFDPDVLNNFFIQISSSLCIFSHPLSYI